MNREEVLEIVRGCSSPVAAINTLIAKGRCHAILEAGIIIDRLNKENNIFTGKKRRWTEEEENFLIEKYTITNMDNLCKILQRTESAITKKAVNLCLDKQAGYISCSRISTITGVDYGALINNKELTKVKRRFSGVLANYVREDIFWTWARKNIEKIDTKRLEKNLIYFINVPIWFKRLNKKSKTYKTHKLWTKTEIETLIFLKENCNYPYKEIAERMGRSKASVSIKYRRLGHEKARREKLKVS